MEASKQACRTTANYFLHLSPNSSNPELMRLCAEGLQELADNYENYSRAVSTCSPFFQELCDTVKAISNDTVRREELQHDNAFSLFEDLAVIIREASLRAGNISLKPIQGAVLSFFENSGLWDANEGTLVSDYYYKLIPGSVVKAPGYLGADPAA